MTDAIRFQQVSRLNRSWQQINSPDHLKLQRPFAPQRPQQPPSNLLPPSDVFNKDRLQLNVSGPARMPAVQLLQVQASASSINRAIDMATGTKNTFNNRIELLVDGKEAFGKMKEYIKSARQSVFVEMFLFHEDNTGWEMANLLVEKRREGVDVKVLLDASGQLTEKGNVVKFMKQNGVDVELYNKKMFDWENLNITHRKLVLVDGYKGITGGMNIGDEYQYKWHDLMATVEGETVQELQSEFFLNWRKSGGKMPQYVPQLPPNMTFGTSATRVTVTSPDEVGKEKDSKNAFISAINSSLHHIYLQHPYFSDEDVISALENAVKRGIEVKVLLPGISDNPIHAVLNKKNAERLIKAGGQVLKVDPGEDKEVFTHGKLMTIDGVWTTIGSTNFDTRALENNQELNISVTDVEFAQTVERRLFQYNPHALIPFESDQFSSWERVKAKVFGFFADLL